MTDARSRFDQRLSAAVAALASLASALGLLVAGVYRDNALVASAWGGNDLVTLFVAAPLLATLSVAGTHRAGRGELVRLGLLDYMLYNYAFYLFGAAFNALFLIYVAIVTLSASSLVLGLVRLDPEAVARRFRADTPVRPIAAYLLFVALGLSAVYIAQSLTFVATGRVPPIVSATGHPTSIVFALDLTLVVPPLALAGAWIWRRRPWGYVLAVVTSVKGAVYMTALTAATFAARRVGALPDVSQAFLWTTLGVASAVAIFVLLGHMKRDPTTP